MSIITTAEHAADGATRQPSPAFIHSVNAGKRRTAHCCAADVPPTHCGGSVWSQSWRWLARLLCCLYPQAQMFKCHCMLAGKPSVQVLQHENLPPVNTYSLPANLIHSALQVHRHSHAHTYILYLKWIHICAITVSTTALSSFVLFTQYQEQSPTTCKMFQEHVPATGTKVWHNSITATEFPKYL